MTYAIKHKETNLWFSGFSQEAPTFGGAPYPFSTKLEAETQAALFVCRGINVQRKAIVND